MVCYVELDSVGGTVDGLYGHLAVLQVASADENGKAVDGGIPRDLQTDSLVRSRN
jgi:hypothetical protein